MKRASSVCLFLAVALLGVGLGVVWLVASPPVAAGASPDGVLTVCPAGPPECQYATVQDAVDAAQEGDVIKVAAGTYAGVRGHSAPPGYNGPAVISQSVYLDMAITIRGGYAPGFPEPPDPVANPTVLDAGGHGRVMVIAGAVSPWIEGLRLTGGDAQGQGGHLWGADTGGGLYVVTATATISNNAVISNTAHHGGGAFLLRQGSTFTGNAISGNTSTTGGGVCQWLGSTAFIRNILTANEANAGGALWLEHGDALVRDNTIVGNEASGGGGIFIGYGGNHSLIGNAISDNHAANWGGGVEVSVSTATLENNRLEANVADFGGGAVYVDEGAVVLSGNTVFSNTGLHDYGGGILVDTGQVTVTGNIIEANWTWYGGGGVALSESDGLLSGNVISGNLALDGGGVYLSASPATISGNTILGNRSHGFSGGNFGHGGGLYLEYSDATIDNNLIVGNDAVDNGGGLFLHQSHVTLDGNVVISNTADVGGGLETNGGSQTIRNSVFARNRAELWGSGLEISAAVTRMVHCTVAQNTGGDGSGVYVGGYVLMTNTIIVSHSVGVTVAQWAYDEAWLEGTLWGSGAWANDRDWGGLGVIVTGTHNYWGDPGFADPPAGDYHLTGASDALDRGIDAGLDHDLDRQPRPNQLPDLGADEYWPPATLFRGYLPVILKN